MLGVVLCGGESIRMQTDKGLIKSNGEVWAQSAYRKLFHVCDNAFVSIKEKQRNAYLPYFGEELFVIDSGNLHFEGPLCGVLSMHLKFPLEDIIVLACDFPNMEPACLIKLKELLEQNPEREAVCYLQHDGHIQALVGAYRGRGLAKLLQLYYENKLVKKSMIFALAQLDIQYVPIPLSNFEQFKNFNDHESLS